MSKQKIREWLENNCNTENIVDIIHQYTQDQSADLDAELEDIINSRDYFEDKATELASDIGEYLGFEVGDHSSSNNPIQNAIDTLYCIKNKIGDYADTQEKRGWVGVDGLYNLPEVGMPVLMHVPLKGFKGNQIVASIREDGVLESMDGEDHGYTIEGIEKWQSLPPAAEALL